MTGEANETDPKFRNSKTPEMLDSDTKEQRLANWQVMESYFRSIIDPEGTSIDEGILEGVVALNLLGINTEQSCEGHLEQGYSYPWIDIAAADTDETQVLVEQARHVAKAAAMKRHAGAPPAEQEAAAASLREIRKKITELTYKPNLEEIRKFLPLLDEFYSDRSVLPEQRLIIHFMEDGIGTLQPQGAKFQELHDTEQKQQALESYRQEMTAFSSFLKAKYIG